VLITFDDGYLDNYLTAFPILKSHGVQGVFFLATSFVGTGAVPWWDTIAYIVRYCKKPVIRLRYPADVEIDLKGLGFQSALRLVLREYKKPSVKDEERFLTGLEEECGVSRPASETMRCFLDWDEAREMQASGMAFGSHTHTHRILARLTNAEQRDECRRSREILEAQLGRQVDTLAYPVGGRDAFSADSIESLKSAGYRAAFSYYGGVNRPGETRRFDVRRFAVDSQSMDRLRLQTALAAVSGSRWF
jgi:peptidoglycan/xylan/chitin deacetylase (PgdA/CDA1 family)